MQDQVSLDEKTVGHGPMHILVALPPPHRRSILPQPTIISFISMATFFFPSSIQSKMAEVLVGIAGVASIAGLADVCCRLASQLYSSTQAVQNAPRTIQALVKRLGHLRELLTDIDGLLKRYSTSSCVTEDGFSVTSLESLLQACKAELTEVGKSTTRFTTMTGQLAKIQEVRRRVKWALDEPKIDKHCDALQELSARLTTALSAAGR